MTTVQRALTQLSRTLEQLPARAELVERPSLGDVRLVPSQPLDLLDPSYRAAAIKVLFGSTGRFALASWLIGREDPNFRLADYGAETGHRMVSAGHVTQFLQMGMVERMVPPPPLPTWYVRLPSPLWRVYAVALDILGDPVAAENEQLKADLLKMLARHSED